MTNALHCNCDVDANRSEYFFHLPECLVGAVLRVAHALTIEGDITEDTSMGAVVRDGLSDIARAVTGEY